MKMFFKLPFRTLSHSSSNSSYFFNIYNNLSCWIARRNVFQTSKRVSVMYKKCPYNVFKQLKDVTGRVKKH